jgi:hypothetical protein
MILCRLLWSQIGVLHMIESGVKHNKPTKTYFIKYHPVVLFIVTKKKPTPFFTLQKSKFIYCYLY